MTKAIKEVSYFINNRPLCFLSTVFSMRDFLLGLALIISAPEIMQTQLVENLDQLGSTFIFGVVILGLAVVTGVTAVIDKTHITRWGLTASSWLWLYACFSYIMAGDWWLAGIFGLLCSIPSGYIAYYYKYAPIWDEPKRKWREEHGMEALL